MTQLPSYNPTFSDAEQAARAAQWEADERAKKLAAESSRIHRWKETMGERYHDCRLSNYTTKYELQKKVRDALVGYLRNIEANLAEGKNLVLYGSVGTGKDHLAAAVLNETGNVMLRRYEAWLDEVSRGNLIPLQATGSVRAILGDDLRAWHKSTWYARRGEETEADIVNKLSASAMLLLSDPVTTVQHREQMESLLFAIIDRRYSTVRPTIITINAYDTENVTNLLGPRIWDRLQEVAEILHCNWPSYRQRGKEPK